MTPCLSMIGFEQKVDSQREHFNNQITELHLRIEEIPRALAALQDTRRSAADTFTFRTADDKLLLQSHISRRNSSRTGAPYTDIAPFTIPDDMRAKVEARIREREAREDAAKAQAELAEAYRRLQLASGNPRVTELRIQVDNCQEEIKRAFQLIRTSNLQLYSCCESKAERLDIATLQNEIKYLRDRIKTMDGGNGAYRMRGSMALPADQPALSPTNTISHMSLMFGDSNKQDGKDSSSDGKNLMITSAQVPELRVSLLELSRNLNVLKHRWKKRKFPNGGSGGTNPVVQTHLDKLIAIINDAYSSTAEEPVDLTTVSKYVEKVGRVLGSDFSVQILALLGGRSEGDICRFQASTGSNEMTRALCKYSEAFTDMFFRNETESKVAGAAMEEWAKTNRNLEKMAQDMSELAEKQTKLEDALVAFRSGMAKASAGSPSPALSPSPKGVSLVMVTPPPAPARDLKNVSDELNLLKDQVGTMSKKFVTEDALMAVLQQLEQCKQAIDRVTSSGGGGPARTPTSISFVRRRSAEGLTNPDFPSTSASLAALVLDTSDERLRSQPKLDPLQVHKMNGEPRPSRSNNANVRWSSVNSSVMPPGGVTGPTAVLGKIQARSQMMRPKSNHQARDN